VKICEICGKKMYLVHFVARHHHFYHGIFNRYVPFGVQKSVLICDTSDSELAKQTRG
jgi:hypothetical protein